MPDLAISKNNGKHLMDYIGAISRIGRDPVHDFQSSSGSDWHKYGGQFLDGHGEALPGISFNRQTGDEQAWLVVERLTPQPPPKLPEQGALAAWDEAMKIADNPEKEPAPPTERIVTSVSPEQVKILLGSEDQLLREEHITKPADDGSVTVSFLWKDDKKAQDEFKHYLDKQWRPWQLSEKPRRISAALYGRLYTYCKSMESGGEDYPLEAVFGVGVAQRWENGCVASKNLVLEQIVEIKMDGTTLIVYPRLDRPPGVGLASYQDHPDILNVTNSLDTMLATDDYALNPFDPTTFSPVVAAACAHLAPDAVYEENKSPLAEKPEVLTFYHEWVVLVRRRDDSVTLSNVVKKFKDKIGNATDYNALPDSLVRVAEGVDAAKQLIPSPPPEPLRPVGGEAGAMHNRGRRRRFFPLPCNKEQETILDTLSAPGCKGMVVQGPPGTGKSHTIANLICHYLAVGKRLLVASHDIPALKVLEDKIPENIRELVVPVLSRTSEGKRKIETAIRRLLEINNTTNVEDISRKIESLDEEEACQHEDICLTKKRVIQLATRQLDRPPDSLTNNFPNRPGEHPVTLLAKWTVESSPDFDWFTDRPEMKQRSGPPDDDAIQRLRMARTALGDDLCYVGKKLPDVDRLPSPQGVRDWHQNIRRVAEIEQDMAKGDVMRFRTTTDISTQAATIESQLNELLAAIADTDTVPWVKGLVSAADLNDENYRGVRSELASLWHCHQKLIGLGVVAHPDYKAIVDSPCVLVWLESKKRKRIIRRPLVSPRARRIRDGFRVNNQKPRTVADWQHVFDFAQWLVQCNTFIARWSAVAIPLVGNVAGAPELNEEFVMWLRGTNRAIAGAEKKARLSHEMKLELPHLFAGDVAQNLTSPDGIRKIIGDIQVNLEKIKNEYTQEAIRLLSDDFDKLGNAAVGGRMRDILSNLGGAEFEQQDVLNKWHDCLADTRRLHGHSGNLQAVCEVTDAIESAGATDWARTLRKDNVQADGDSSMPENWRDAWRWGCANRWLDDQEATGEMKTLMEHLRDVESNHKRTLGSIIELRAKRSLKIALTNNSTAAQNLNVFVNAIGRAPVGPRALWGPVYRRMANQAMEQCYQAIPCWVMPSWRANDILPAEMGAFDLVIVDEASQSDVTELVTLMRGKKVLVVGDDKQVAPVFFGQAGEAQAIMNRHIKGLPVYEALNPQSSLYDIASNIFSGNTIMLKEHFRCAEPIIAFSSREFYEDKIKPLRVPTIAERMSPPLVDVFVRDGVEIPEKVNKAEARAIVDEIGKLRNDVQTNAKSIAVISLVGHEQAKYIFDLLAGTFGVDHGVRCGPAAYFQGSESDIVFLSMVKAPVVVAWNSRVFEQRFNVAASRARDRLYLYRSVQPNDLRNPNDLKLRLIQHFENPMPRAAQKQKADRCESQFEREFFDRLTQKRYYTVPQVGSVGFRIDLVVEGENGNRLAVELDGDRFHQDWAADFTRQQVLERVGWHFWRCFASTYYRNKDRVFNELLEELSRLKIHPWQPDVVATEPYVEHREVSGARENDDEEETNGNGEEEPPFVLANPPAPQRTLFADS